MDRLEATGPDPPVVDLAILRDGGSFFRGLTTGGVGRDPESDLSRDWSEGTCSRDFAVVVVRDLSARWMNVPSRVLMTSARGGTRTLILADWREGSV